MGDPTGFLKIHRVPMPERDPARARAPTTRRSSASCPTPSCATRAPAAWTAASPSATTAARSGNLIPDWNDLVYRDRWREAIDQLHATNNFPEFTGLICPAPCESACVLAINDDPVMIKQIEYAIVHRAWEEGWIVPVVARRRARAAASPSSAPGPPAWPSPQQLNTPGHTVVVFERDEGPGGLLRFGVPDAKLEKWMIDRRVDVLEAEGVEFRYGVDVGRGRPVDELRAEFDAVVVATGSRVPRDIDGRRAASSPASTTRWTTSTSATAGSRAQEGRPSLESPPRTSSPPPASTSSSSAAATPAWTACPRANREGAASVVMYDVYPEVPPGGRYPDSPWPEHPRRTDDHLRARRGRRAPLRHPRSRRIVGEDGRVIVGRGPPGAGHLVAQPAPRPGLGVHRARPTSCWSRSASPTRSTRASSSDLGVDLDARGNVKAGASFATSVDGVFACGDARRGQSLVVTAIAEGRRCARAVDRWLAGVARAAVLDARPIHVGAAFRTLATVHGPIVQARLSQLQALHAMTPRYSHLDLQGSASRAMRPFRQ